MRTTNAIARHYLIGELKPFDAELVRGMSKFGRHSQHLDQMFPIRILMVSGRMDIQGPTMAFLSPSRAWQLILLGHPKVFKRGLLGDQRGYLASSRAVHWIPRQSH